MLRPDTDSMRSARSCSILYASRPIRYRPSRPPFAHASSRSLRPAPICSNAAVPAWKAATATCRSITTAVTASATASSAPSPPSTTSIFSAPTAPPPLSASSAGPPAAIRAGAQAGLFPSAATPATTAPQQAALSDPIGTGGLTGVGGFMIEASVEAPRTVGRSSPPGPARSGPGNPCPAGFLAADAHLLVDAGAGHRRPGGRIHAHKDRLDGLQGRQGGHGPHGGQGQQEARPWRSLSPSGPGGQAPAPLTSVVRPASWAVPLPPPTPCGDFRTRRFTLPIGSPTP